MHSNKYFMQCAELAVRALLYTKHYDTVNDLVTVPCISYDNVIDALNKAIGLGGGFTIDNIGNYWLVNYNPGLNISIVRTEDGKIIDDKIPRSITLKIAQTLWNEYHKKERQLTLF